MRVQIHVQKQNQKKIPGTPILLPGGKPATVIEAFDARLKSWPYVRAMLRARLEDGREVQVAVGDVTLR